MFTARSAGRHALPVAWSLLVGAIGLAGGGCSNDGSYQVSWAFTSEHKFGPVECGRVGVSGIAIAATEQGGGVSRQVVSCGLGTFTGKLSQGTWSLALTALDAEGQDIEPAPSPLLRGAVPAPVDVKDGEVSVVPDPVLLPPLPECRDGVDNDHDGRVDLDDPDCAGSPEGPYECTVAGGDPCPDMQP